MMFKNLLSIAIKAISCICVCTAFPLQFLAGEERVLQFPYDRAVGQVSSRPSEEGVFGVDGDLYEKWELVGTAQGEVKVPAGHLVQLNVSKAASKDLSFLENLDPTAIDVLNLRGTDVSNDGLRHVSRLTGLQYLNLQQAKITDACAPHFAALKKLVRIDLSAFDVNRAGFGVGDKVLATLAALPALESVSLRLTKVTDAGMAELAKCPSLRSVAIEGTAVTDAGLVHLAKLPRLKGLELGVYEEGAKVTDAGMATVGQMEGLDWLRLNGTPITGEGLKHLAGLKQLRILDIDYTKVTNADLSFLEPMTGLERLRLFGNVNDEGAQHLGKLKNLQSISANLEISDIGVAHLAKLPHLQELMLSEGKVTDASIAEIAKMPELKTLWFQYCEVTDEGLANLKGHPTLEYVLFYELPITTASLKTFATWPKLKFFNVDVDRKHDPNPDWSALAELTQVESMDVGGDAFESKDMVHIAGLKQLTHLEVEPQKPLDDEGMMHIADLENLEGLDLRSSEITDAGMEALRNKPKLKNMTVSGLITDKGLAALYDSKSLQYLQIASPYVTDEGLTILEQHVPTLQDVNRYNYRLKDWYVSASAKDKFLRKGELKGQKPKDDLEDKPAPKLHVKNWFNQEKKDLQLSDLLGKVVIVHFWTAGESRSLDKIPELKKLYEEFQEAGVVILAIHTTADAANAEMYVSPLLMPWPVGIDADDQTKAAWAADDYPAYYLVDRAGKIRFADLYPEQLAEAVKFLMEEQ